MSPTVSNSDGERTRLRVRRLPPPSTAWARHRARFDVLACFVPADEAPAGTREARVLPMINF